MKSTHVAVPLNTLQRGLFGEIALAIFRLLIDTLHNLNLKPLFI